MRSKELSRQIVQSERASLRAAGIARFLSRKFKEAGFPRFRSTGTNYSYNIQNLGFRVYRLGCSAKVTCFVRLDRNSSAKSPAREEEKAMKQKLGKMAEELYPGKVRWHSDFDWYVDCAEEGI
jgi:hypothetical protein